MIFFKKKKERKSEVEMKLKRNNDWNNQEVYQLKRLIANRNIRIEVISKEIKMLQDIIAKKESNEV